MSTKRGGVPRGPPKHQNRRAYKPFQDVKKNPGEPGGSDGQSFAPIGGVCIRCKEILEWKRKYGKYKPLVQPTKCIWCQKRNVRSAYHAICSACASSKGACAKCCKQVKNIIGKDGEQEEAERRRLEEALSGMRERDRRTLLRVMERGSVNVEKSSANEDPAEGGEEDSDAETDSSLHEDSEASVREDLGDENATASVSQEGLEGGKTVKSRQCELSDSTSEWESEDEREDSDTKAETSKGGNRTAPGEVNGETAHEDKDTQGFDEAVGSSQAGALKLGSRLTSSLIIEEGKETSSVDASGGA